MDIILSKPKAGVFISVEGADGSGKSTCAKEMVDYLNSNSIEAIYAREPGGTKFGELMRNTVIDFNEVENGEIIDPTTRLLQFISLRVQHVKRVIIPAVRAGKVVVCDRFMDSTDVYNGKMDMQGLLIKQLYSTHTLKFLSVRPDFTFVFDVRKEVGLQRVNARGKNALDEKYANDSYTHWHNKKEELIAQYGLDKIKVINANSTLENSIERTHQALQASLDYFNSINPRKAIHSYCYDTEDVFVG